MQTETMFCGTCVAPGQFELISQPMPKSAPDGWVLVETAAVGICGTDYHIFDGKHPFLNYPRVIGHELSAHVVQDAGPWRAGQLVVVNPYLSCGICRACTRGKPNCCMAIEVLGVHRDGGMCARFAVPEGNLYAADGLTARQAAMVEFLAIGAHAVARSGVGAGDLVLVTGAGPIGLGTALFAKAAGAVVHLLDTSAARLAAARAFGFDTGLLPGQDLPVQGGYDVVFDATGNTKAIEAGFAHVAHGGTYVLVSVVRDEITFSDPEFHKREMRLIGSRNALVADFEAVMTALRTGAIDAALLESEVLTLADLPARFPDLVANRDGIIKVIVDFGLPDITAGAVA
ncbi:zinc-binding alcohol dehydrogenase family protein [Pseudorhodobacter ferrugineus]|uniref:zinc-binding alcohol dehydrogenase family protein n=1 Tax=Pseudorhodobacter ferrugineus TaxID=77008 RepID=UPI000A443651|nr:zinc-binding alcohol dehydrogenase family protein [Pseudorhodobacter ferrugineus]